MKSVASTSFDEKDGYLITLKPDASVTRAQVEKRVAAHGKVRGRVYVVEWPDPVVAPAPK